MAELKTGTTIGGNVAWHDGNDGAGSNLDADKLDGYHYSSFGSSLNYNGTTLELKHAGGTNIDTVTPPTWNQNTTGTAAGLTTARAIQVTLTGDVTGTGQANFDGTGAINISFTTTIESAGHALSEHSDVTLASIASGELLKWNGSAWVNNTLAEAGIAGVAIDETITGTWTFDESLNIAGGLNVDGTSVMNSFRYLQNIAGAIFENNEGDTIGAIAGAVIFDENFYNDAEYGDAWPGGDGGGLAVYSGEDGWNRLISDKNMGWLDADFYSLDINGTAVITNSRVLQNVTANTSILTAGSLDDGRVGQSNVTQHEAALSIGWGQLTSLPPMAENDLLDERATSAPNSAGDTYGFNVHYMSSSASPAPPGTDHSLITTSYSNAWQNQIAQDWRNDGRMYIRSQNSGTWGSWYQIWSEADFTTTDIGYWDTAYGWGDHASAGYGIKASAEDITGGWQFSTTGTLGGPGTWDSNLGSAALKISEGATKLYFDGNTIVGNSIINIGTLDAGDAVSLYHNQDLKLATTTTGIDVTGILGVSTGIVAPYFRTHASATYPFQIYGTGASNAFVVHEGAGATFRMYKDADVGYLTRAGSNSLGIAISASGVVNAPTGLQVGGADVASQSWVGSWAGSANITTVGTLSSGAIPAELITAGKMANGDYSLVGSWTIEHVGNGNALIIGGENDDVDFRMGNFTSGVYNGTNGFIFRYKGTGYGAQNNFQFLHEGADQSGVEELIYEVTQENTPSWDFKITPSINGQDITTQYWVMNNYPGTILITTVGIVTAGTWNATAIADGYIASGSNWNTAYSERGSQIAGDGLTWDGSQLDVDAVSVKRVILGKTTNQQWTGTSGGAVAITWESQEFIDTDTYTHSTVTNNSRIYVDSDGVYEITFNLDFTNADSARVTLEAAVKVNGTTYWDERVRNYSRGSGYGDLTLNMTHPPRALSAGDYIEVFVAIDDADTGNINIDEDNCSISIKKVATVAPANTWRNIDTTPTSGVSDESISSGWAYTHENDTGNGGHIPAAGAQNTWLSGNGTFMTIDVVDEGAVTAHETALSIARSQITGTGVLSAGNGLSGDNYDGGDGSKNWSVDYAGSGGNYGTATTVARSDHTHDPETTPEFRQTLHWDFPGSHKSSFFSLPKYVEGTGSTLYIGVVAGICASGSFTVEVWSSSTIGGTYAKEGTISRSVTTAGEATGYSESMGATSRYVKLKFTSADFVDGTVSVETYHA
jgi:hypothetical protein